jgi:hypothetical protein
VGNWAETLNTTLTARTRWWTASWTCTAPERCTSHLRCARHMPYGYALRRGQRKLLPLRKRRICYNSFASQEPVWNTLSLVIVTALSKPNSIKFRQLNSMEFSMEFHQPQFYKIP